MDAGKGLLNSLQNVLLEPTEKNSPESGQILARMQDGNGFNPHKLRDPHLDVVIAMTARSIEERSKDGTPGVDGCGRKPIEGWVTQSTAQVEQ